MTVDLNRFSKAEMFATIVRSYLGGSRIDAGTFGTLEEDFPGCYRVTLTSGQSIVAHTNAKGWQVSSDFGWVCDDPDLEIAIATVINAGA